ncbi:MAG: PAS domain S-box protein, partial [Anaerolineae bacterium]|nr:PAS domain S-box protein [Anaerolineae bacterium]
MAGMDRVIMTKDEKREERVRAEEKYKALVDAAADAIFTLDLLGRFTFLNPAAERISGYGEEELVGKHFKELLPAKYIPACLNMFQKALRGQPTPPIEIELVTKEGKRVPLELLGRPIKRGRRVVEIIGIARDITERKRAEETLRESHENYKELADSIADVFFAMDKDLRYTYWNKASEDLTGISAKDAIGKSLYEVFPDTPQTRRAETVYLDVLRTQQPQSFLNEYQLGGKDFAFEISAYPTRDGLSVFVKDITERKRAEEALGERVKELTCLHAVSRDMQEDLSLDELCRRTIEHLVQAMQFPEITVPVIELDSSRFTHERYTEGLAHGLRAVIRAGGEARGQLRAYYAE